MTKIDWLHHEETTKAEAISALKAQADGDCISRQAAIDVLGVFTQADALGHTPKQIVEALPPVQQEPLTDKEQRIFLAAMGREEKVCEEVDRNYVREPYEDSLVRVCKEIRRKVKGALWT